MSEFRLSSNHDAGHQMASIFLLELYQNALLIERSCAALSPTQPSLASANLSTLIQGKISTRNPAWFLQEPAHDDKVWPVLHRCMRPLAVRLC